MIKTVHDPRAIHSRAVSLVLIGVLSFVISACGGGGGGASIGAGNTSVPPLVIEDMDGSGTTLNTYTEFAETTSGRTSTFTTVAINNAQGAALALTGRLDHATGIVTSGDLEGTFDAQRTILTLSDSGAFRGTVTLTNPAATEYVRFFQTSGLDDNLFGVVGQATFWDDLPTQGSPQYNGVVIMEVNNEGGTYILRGDAVITVNWNIGVDALFNNLSGSLNGDETRSVAGTVEISKAALSETSFAGGEIAVTGTIFASSDPVVGTFEGQIFGRNADELGGTLTLVSDADDLNVGAVFAAE